jgi:hypothetical protein
MTFITITLIVHAPDPFTGAQKSTRHRFREVLDSALLAEDDSQDAIDAYRPVFAGQLAAQERLGLQPVFLTLEDFIERSSALIGSPAQVIEKVHRGGPLRDDAVPDSEGVPA